MNRWTWVSLGVVLVAGAGTARYWSQLLAYNMAGLQPRAVDPELLARSLFPSGLFAAAALLRRWSARMQLAVGASAVGVGVLQVLTIRGELAADWSRGTGFISFLALAVGTGVATVVLLAAAVATVREYVGRRRSAPQDA